MLHLRSQVQVPRIPRAIAFDFAELRLVGRPAGLRSVRRAVARTTQCLYFVTTAASLSSEECASSRGCPCRCSWSLDQEVIQLRKVAAASFEQAKADVESRIAEFDTLVKASNRRSRQETTDTRTLQPDAGQRERTSRLAPAFGFGRTMPRRRIVETSEVRFRPSLAAAPWVPPMTHPV